MTPTQVAQPPASAEALKVATASKEAAQAAILREFLSDPENYEAYRVRFLHNVRREYAPIFKHLGLSPSERGAVAAVLAEKKLQFFEAMLVSEGNRESTGSANALSLTKVSGTTHEDVNQALLSVVDPERASVLTDFTRRSKEWTVVDQVAETLSESGEPMSSQQIVALVRFLGENSTGITSDAARQFMQQSLNSKQLEMFLRYTEEQAMLRRIDNLNTKLKAAR